MSDDDFVTTPVRRSKRRKSNAAKLSLNHQLLNYNLARNDISIMTTGKQICEKQVEVSSSPCNYQIQDKLKVKSLPDDSGDSDRSHENDREYNSSCATDKCVSLAAIKSATESLCSRKSSTPMRQTSLLALLKGGSTSFVSEDKMSDKPLCYRQETPCKVSICQTPRSERKLVRQPGTSQLDLGAMLGMTPKHIETSVKPKSESKPVPFYKWVKGTTFIVDGFNYGKIPRCTAYFLSHFHYDHYIGLNKNFEGIIYCSKVTANYVIGNLKVKPEFVKVLEFDKPGYIQGVEVSLIEANHCPGSAMFLFESPTLGCILHTGDFRFDRSMLDHHLLKHKNFDMVYLDTTYFDPAYEFPSQRDVIEFMVNEVQMFTSDTLVVCGSYNIGKERLVEGIAKELDCKIHASQTKINVINLQENAELTSRLSKNINSRVHVVPMKEVNSACLAKLLARTNFSSVVGVKPTGWTHTDKVNLHDIKPTGCGMVRIYNLPYSEHSSFTELREFVRAISARKIIATVMPRAENKRKFMFDKLSEWTSAK